MDRHGEKWNIYEETNLLNRIKTLSITDVAKQHKRSEGAIISRLKLIAIRLHTKKYDIKNIIEITKLTENQILECIEKNQINIEKLHIKKVTNISNIINLQEKIIELMDEKFKMSQEIIELKSKISDLLKN
jgi:hypothetical protein